MNFDCIISQVHIPDYDVQGNLDKEQKLKLVEFGIRHLRKFNPNSYIILTGHGHRPNGLELCDYSHWDDRCLPLNEHGYVIGMPAQFVYVSIGMEHALSKKFDRILKTRGDCIIGIPDITSHCNQILDQEEKQFLITQQTGPERMGDCFMYGDLKLLSEIWWKGNNVWNADGLQNTAVNFRKVLRRENTNWYQLLRETCAFRDVNKLKFTCLRWNFHRMGRLSEEMQQQLLNPNYDFEPYHWGRANGWHIFDPNGNMSGSADWLWSQKGFYESAYS